MLIKVRDSRTETVRSKDLMGRWWNPDEDIISNPMDHIEELKCYLSKVFESKTHPLGKVMRILVLTFEASYSPQHPAILHIALRNVSKFESRVLSSENLVTINCHRKRVWTKKSEIRSVLNCLHNILRCLFFGLPKPGGRDDLRSGPGPLILPTLLPKIYASLQGKQTNI